MLLAVLQEGQMALLSRRLIIPDWVHAKPFSQALLSNV
jgi:hypothetical protein